MSGLPSGKAGGCNPPMRRFDSTTALYTRLLSPITDASERNVWLLNGGNVLVEKFHRYSGRRKLCRYKPL